MKLRASWTGPAPRIGDYLMAEIRPRYAYRIERVTMAFPDVHWDAKAKKETRLLQIIVDRVDKDTVPQLAKIHGWKWDRRKGFRGVAR